MSSPSPSSSQSHEVFSVRIVSIDYYMSPPIPAIELCRSAAFQGRKVQEVPVIRIYGSTPAGQKACLHVHQALPYLYIPCPEDVLQNPEEGHTFLNILSSALEKALRSKSTAPKRQHIHGCHFVRAKKIYGYHASDDLFVKIYLYYPHEVPHLASLLLGGAILNKTFQPYESHIPYLLQFLVDYNLYGMGHIHTSRFKFRLPIPNNYIHKVDSFKKYDMQALGNSAIWLSSTVPSVLIWPDSAVGTGGLEERTNDLISRQSVCDVEVDASVDDIINEKCKMYSSLSQTRSEVKMVQSLVPIWEEEYERSGTPEAAKSPVISKPLPKIVLRRFLHGLEYDRALSELCAELEKIYPSEVSAIEGDKLLEKSIRLLTNSGETLTLLEPHRGNCPSQDGLSWPKDECKSIPSTCILPHKHKEAVLYEKIPEIDQLKSNSEESLSEMHGNANKEGTDSEALGLLSWLASSQAMEEFSADDELVHEAILNPLFPTKSYSETLEIAHLDYESASQQECQDILDSAEDFLKTEGLKEHKSLSACDDDSVNVSAVNLIPQLDGSSDENVCAPQKGDKSETNTTSGRAKSSADQMGKGTSRRFANKCRSKLLWGPLPFPMKEKDQEDFKCGSLVSSQKEMENYRGCSSSVNEGTRICERVHKGVETTDEKEGNMDRTFSMRDLMRKKRCFRTEQLETELQDSDMVTSCPEVSKHHTFDKGRSYLLPTETSKVESSGADLDDVVQENETCFTTSKQDACMEGYDISSIDDFGRKPKLSLPLSDQETRLNVHLNQPLPFNKTFKDGEGAVFNTSSQSLVVTGQMGPPAESIKISESCQTMHLQSAVCNVYLGGHEDGMTEASPSTMKSYKRYVRSQFTSQSSENQSGSRHSEHQYESHSGDELLKENHNSWTEDFINAHPEQTSAQRRQDDQITQEEFLEINFNSSSHKGKDTLNHLEVTFRRTPPSRYEVDGLSEEDCPESATHVDVTSNVNAELMPFCSVGACRQWVNELPPFFGRNSEDEKLYKLYLNDENHIYPRESALGVPTHFQNDGSILYLLTHAVSPPTQECVYQWLLENLQRDHLNDSSGDAYGGVSPESNVANILKTDLSLSSQDDIKPHKNRNHISHVDIVSKEQHTVSMRKKENALKDNWRDLSQISCPDQEEKSRLTPLSQIGFSDPANIGGGQQLTLISIEVQAESRGDLRPDPLIDGINILSFAIQEDTSHTLDVYVLIRCNNEESCARNVDGVPQYKFLRFNDEKLLLDHFVKIISSIDPDVLMGWEVQGGSLGFLAKRAARLGISLLRKISRVPAYDSKHDTTDSLKTELSNVNHEELIADTSVDDSIVEDEWGRTHASGIHVRGRIVLNIWRLMRSELKLNMYSIEAVAEEVLRQKIPSISCQVLNRWFSSGPGRARYRCIEYVTERAKLNLQIMNKLDMINRTSELARVFGIDFFSVLSRGSQFRVESMLLRLAHTQNYVAISPGNQQVASQPAMECLPLVMEPESGFYSDPVVVLDFQSLYPSMIIAYNLCFSTCLGPVIASKANILGVSSYMPDPVVLKDLKEDILLTPNGVMYVPPKVRKGVLPRLLDEILSTRIMLKQAMKKLTTSQQVLQRILNARQLALKLIANVTYGYTAAGFSGRMPCAELADSIVQCGRRTLESAISFVNTHDKWKARVIYGDTDSMFVLLKGRSREEAFRIGNEIASAITALNPNPVTLKMEKVYHPCFLLTKKRYVGYSFENPDQDKPSFDAKGIETVRRDSCPAVAKSLERSIRLFFDHQDISLVKSYLQRQWRRILSGKISLQDFVFAKEVRLGTYSARASALPPAAIVATKAMRIDPRAEPQYGERVPYLVIHGEPGARLVDMVVDPSVVLEINSPYRLNELYYITKQIIPALQRVFGLVGGDLKQWFAELPRSVRPTLAKRHSYVSHSGSLNEYDDDNMSESSKKAQVKRSRIDNYYISKHCALCGDLAQASASLCDRCSKESFVAAAVIGKASKLEREIQHLVAICRHCGGADWVIERGVKCTSLACSVFYERRKVQKEFRSISSFAAASGFYPTCTPEWF